MCRRIVRYFLNEGQYTFTVQQWAERTGQESKSADYQCRHLFQKGLLDRDKRGSIMTYTFRVIASHEEPAAPSDDKEDSCKLATASDQPLFFNRAEKLDGRLFHE